MEQVFPLVIFVIIAFAIAHFLGKKRQIGFGWSFFFCIFLSPIGGFILTMLSKRHYLPDPKPSKLKKIIGWILILPFTFLILSVIFNLNSNASFEDTVNVFFVSIGFAGLGYYLIQFGNGKNFNDASIIKKERNMNDIQ